MLLMVVVSSVVATAATNALSDLNRAAAQVRRATALQAAEAGVADYVAKLAQDRKYHLHYVHPAESTRRDSTGRVVAAGGGWGDVPAWTYPTPLNAWRQLANGYEYNLEIVPGSTGNSALTIISTGRKQGGRTELRRVEVKVKPSSVADFLLITNGGVNYRADAVTRGKVYAGQSTAIVNGAPVITKQNIDHPGTAYADLLAEGQVTNVNLTRLKDGARAIDSDSVLPDPGTGFATPPIRTELPNPINFNLFTDSMVDVQAAAGTAFGVKLDDPAVALWEMTFRADATIAVRRCTLNGDPAEVQPTCGGIPDIRPMPTNGAIYTGQSTIVSGVVDGQATVVSNFDIIIGGDITYEQRGNDVIGLIAKNGVHNAVWLSTGADNTLDIYAAIIAQQERFRSWDTQTVRYIQMRHVGSTATMMRPYQVYTSNQTGLSTGGIDGPRVYEYDPNLQFLEPPYYPTLEEGYEVTSFRELVPPVVP